MVPVTGLGTRLLVHKHVKTIVSPLVATARYTRCSPRDPQVNKFEQVSDGDHQKSITGRGELGVIYLVLRGGIVQ